MAKARQGKASGKSDYFQKKVELAIGNLATDTEKGRELFPVQVYRLNPTLAYGPEKKRTDGFIIHHVPTGYAIRRGFRTAAGAREFIESVAHLDWNFSDPRNKGALDSLWPAVKGASQRIREEEEKTYRAAADRKNAKKRAKRARAKRAREAEEAQARPVSNRPADASRIDARPRPICVIARDIDRCWPKVSVHAKPYLRAMFQLNGPDDTFYCDNARSVVNYFLANAHGFRGPAARELKAELKALLQKGARA